MQRMYSKGEGYTAAIHCRAPVSVSKTRSVGRWGGGVGRGGVHLKNYNNDNKFNYNLTSKAVMLKCRLQTAVDCADHPDWEFFFYVYYFSVSFTLVCRRCVLINFLLFPLPTDAWKPGMVLEKIYIYI